MKVRDEIQHHAEDEDKPILNWLFDRYHWASEWRFVAVCGFERYGVESYKTHRVWAPTKEGRALYEYDLNQAATKAYNEAFDAQRREITGETT